MLKQTQISKRSGLCLKELESLKKARLQTFTHWPHSIPSREHMVLNGWFYCQIADRTLCIYCNTLCQNWTIYDDPYEVHANAAPHCPFLQSIKPSSVPSNSSSNRSITNETMQVRHPHMLSVTSRIDSFNKPTWTFTSPSVESLAQAGFFLSNTSNVVTCFYCNGSLHQWGANDSPKIEHARWFPHCTYARHLCGDSLHARIQLANHKRSNETKSLDNETVNRLVQPRLDLPIVERLQQDYKLEIIKHCLEEQFRKNHDDFPSDYDLTIACMILKKQTDILEGKLGHIVKLSKSSTDKNSMEISDNNADDCLICLEEKRQLACLPCGHLCVCVSCGYALQGCPICREKIQSFVRIYC